MNHARALVCLERRLYNLQYRKNRSPSPELDDMLDRAWLRWRTSHRRAIAHRIRAHTVPVHVSEIEPGIHVYDAPFVVWGSA